MTRLFGAAALLATAVAVAAPGVANAGSWQCVTYARSVSNFNIRGNANTWWSQADGRYQRGHAPAAGAVLAFKSIPGMRAGHVAVVREVLSDREVRIDHANWTVRGGVERDARAVDVSPAGDWSAVRVSYGHGMGTRINPTFGFIYAGGGTPPVQMAPVQMAHAPRAPLQLGSDLAQLAAVEASTAS